METLLSILLFGGFTVWVLQHIVSQVFEYRRYVGKIAYEMTNSTNVYANPGNWPKDKMDKVANRARGLSSTLAKVRTQIFGYRFFVFLNIIPPAKDVVEAERLLIGLSNGTHSGNAIWNGDAIDKIRRLLRIT